MEIRAVAIVVCVLGVGCAEAGGGSTADEASAPPTGELDAAATGELVPDDVRCGIQLDLLIGASEVGADGELETVLQYVRAGELDRSVGISCGVIVHSRDYSATLLSGNNGVVDPNCKVPIDFPPGAAVVPDSEPGHWLFHGPVEALRAEYVDGDADHALNGHVVPLGPSDCIGWHTGSDGTRVQVWSGPW